MSNPQIHPLADVKSNRVGAGTRIWQFVVILPGAQLGSDGNICSHCFVENDVIIGDRVTIKNGVQIWDGLRIEDDVFIGPNVTFTNDPRPRSKHYPTEFLKTVVEKGASIGAGAAILPGVKIGREAMIGAGAVITKDVPPRSIVVGNPGRIAGYVNAQKQRLDDHQSTAEAGIDRTGTHVRGVEIFDLTHSVDMRGALTAVEFSSHLPFEPKRTFLVSDVPNQRVRGEHAHRECHQFLICVKGSVAVIVDDGKASSEFTLDRPDRGIYLPPMTWGIQYKYSRDAVLLVFASHPYDSADYIRDYEEFRKLTDG